ncbi:MAG: C40 family peptidase [Solirubrobacteraceae bacterium]|nr:C40 family peptidase [Solirubrobacteraceae bacterium]
MSSHEVEAAARLLERLLAEPELRRQFRRDPVGSCRAAGLDNVAIEMEVATGKAAHTVDLRESKSSLAGVLMAAAVEGVAVWQLIEHAGAAGGAAADLVSHVSMPAIKPPHLDLPDVQLPDANIGSIALPGSGGGGASGIAATPSAPDAAAGGVADASGGAGAAPAEAASAPADGGAAGGGADAAGAADASGGGAAADAAAGGDAAAAQSASVAPAATPGEPVAERSAQAAPTATPGASSDTLSMRVAERSSGPSSPQRDPNASISFAVPGHPGVGSGSGGGGADAVAEQLGTTGPTSYPGDDASQAQLAAWMAAEARERGLPGELPVMAALVESGLKNVQGGDRDSVGFFQMRVGIWNEGAYEGYPKNPELQLKWFLDQAQAQRAQRIASGRSVSDPHSFGEWIADVERPAAQYRGRYQFQLDRARELLRSAQDAPAQSPSPSAEPVAVRSAISVADASSPAGAPVSAVEAGRAALDNPKLHFDDVGVSDLKAGRIDPRLLAVLGRLSEHHDLRISCMRSDHSKFTAGGSISNHWHGRGIDIAAVDGRPVNASNHAAREVAERLAKLDTSIRPTEIGTPWPLAGPGYFTDGAHQDHLHVGFDDALPEGWRPPPDLAPTGQAAEAQAVRASTATPAGTPTDAGPDTLSFGARAERADAGKGDAADQSLQFPAVRPPDDVPRSAAEPVGVRAEAPGGSAAGGGDQAAEAVADAARGGAAGPQALAAVAEAKKYLGTPYQWGGASPKTNFDCSGLVQWAYAKQGIAIPRVTYDQIDAPNATKVGLHALRPGDLVFFATPDGDVHHVGMSLGGDRFIHAPHTGDVVKISRLSEPYYRQQFAGGRRFDQSAPALSAAPAPAAAPADLQVAERQQVADAEAVQNPDTLVFKALSRQEASHHASTLQFLAVKDRPRAERLAVSARDAGLDLGDAPVASGDYPGDDAGKEALARWLGEQARRAGLPPELPVMASLVESGVQNLSGGDRDSVGFFQMRVGIWNSGKYEGYPDRPELQVRWFIDKALEVKRARLASGDRAFLDDPKQWGNWIADVERPAEQYRGRYQERLEEARQLLGR